MGDKIGVSKCDCGGGGTVEWTLMKNHGASGKCLSCGEQRFKRSPKAVDGLNRQLAGTEAAPKKPGEDGAGEKKGGFLGEALDLDKL